MTLRRSATYLFTLVAALSCGGDSMGPGGLGFPQLSSALRALYCIKGNTTVGETKSSTISSADCDDGTGYYETYIVRVAEARSVTFSVNSSFDSFLILVRIDSYTDADYTATFLDADDDSNGNLDALITYTLNPGVNYAILTSGLDYSDTGNYSLQIQ